MMICCGMTVKRCDCEEDEGTDCTDGQKQWLVKVDRIRHALCIEYMKLIVKHFFLADILFSGFILD